MKNCAIIGSTKIAEIHAREFLKNGIKDITLVSRNIKKSKNFSEYLTSKFNKKIKFSNHQIFKKKKFNLISICSNTKYHLKNLKMVKNKNTKILVEKPLMPLKNVKDLKYQLDKIYFKYPNLFISYPMYYLIFFFIKNFKIDKKIISIKVYYQTRGRKSGLEIFFDLAPHVIIVIMNLIKKKLIKIDNISTNIKKNNFSASFKISDIKSRIELLQLKHRKKSIFKFEINKKKINRITKLEKNVFTNYLEYKGERKFLKNPMSNVIKNFIQNDKTSKAYKINKKITYELSHFTKQIYDQRNN